MSQSLAAVYLHAVFSTKQRHPFLQDEQGRRHAHAYLAEVTKRLDCPAIEIGGYHDHVHILARLGKSIAVSDWLKEVKRVSSIRLKDEHPGFTWQAGYGLFSVDARGLDAAALYVRNQVEHHRKISYQDELDS